MDFEKEIIEPLEKAGWSIEFIYLD